MTKLIDIYFPLLGNTSQLTQNQLQALERMCSVFQTNHVIAIAEKNSGITSPGEAVASIF